MEAKKISFGELQKEMRERRKWIMKFAYGFTGVGIGKISFFNDFTKVINKAGIYQADLLINVSPNSMKEYITKYYDKIEQILIIRRK